MKNTLISTCCGAVAKPDRSGASLYFCTKCVKGCNVTAHRRGFGSKPSTLSKVRKPTGELKLLAELIKRNGPYSMISGDELVGPDHDKYHWQVFHILGKGEYPEMRLEESNVILSTWQEQDAWTKRKESLRNKPEWKPVFYREEQMKLAIRKNDRMKPFAIAEPK